MVNALLTLLAPVTDVGPLADAQIATEFFVQLLGLNSPCFAHEALLSFTGRPISVESLHIWRPLH